MTRTTDNPFAPRGALSREQMERYVRGELTPAEQQEVELHIAHDPLSADAMEGLRMPGAWAGLDRMRAHRPADRGISGRTWLVMGAVVLTLIVAFRMTYSTTKQARVAATFDTPVATAIPVTVEDHTAFETELHQATALPESLRSAFRGGDRFIQPQDSAVPAVREEPPPQAEVIPPAAVIPAPVAEERPRSMPEPKPGRKLMFFFDLKLVHPKELYPIDPVLELADGSVDARFSDARAKAEARPQDVQVPYDRYFKSAMSKFARGDRQGCLEDLFVVLEEYPEDVNALFYAGLCCYDLGLFPRAAALLDRARSHPVDTFLEEAEWYHALAVERTSGRTDALPLLNSVVDRHGFYSARAQEHMAAGH